MKTTKKVKSTSQKSLESIIYDKNGNSYHHHQKITHSHTTSYKSSMGPFDKDTDHDSNHSNHSNHSQSDSNATNPDQPNLNLNKKRDSQKKIRRYSALWDNKKLSTQEFGSDIWQ